MIKNKKFNYINSSYSNIVRDFQKTKLYFAEDDKSVDKGEKFKSIEEIQEFVDKILSSIWYFKYERPSSYTFYNKEKITTYLNTTKPYMIEIIEVKRPHTSATGYRQGNKGYIKIPKKFWNKLVVLHELAHILQTEFPFHGEQFARIFLDFIKRWIGIETYKQLKSSFIEYEVKFLNKK